MQASPSTQPADWETLNVTGGIGGTSYSSSKALRICTRLKSDRTRSHRQPGWCGGTAVIRGLEVIEERAHACLMRAIEVGNPFQIKAAQKLYLRSSETLRRPDLAVETERRNAEEQVPMRQIEDIALQIATWLRLALDQFLSSESRSLMGIKDHGEFMFLVIEGFRGIL
jgi:hypothetical protein